jgi:hypothetical protein
MGPTAVAPTLVFDGYRACKSHVTLPVPFGIQSLTCLWVKNNQLASAETIYNVKVKIEYLHDGSPEFTVHSALWWHEPAGWQARIDLDANESQCVPLFMQPLGHTSLDPPWPQSALDDHQGARSLRPGRWTLRVTVTADGVPPLVGEVDFTVYKEQGQEGLFIGCNPPMGCVRLPLEPAPEIVDREWIRELDDLNLVATVEVLEDLVQELNISVSDEPVTIHMWNQVIRYLELHPGDGAGIRDAYMERRVKILNFLMEKGVIKEFEIVEGSHRWENRLAICADRATVRDALKSASAEHICRNPPRPKPTPKRVIGEQSRWTRNEKLTLAALLIAALGALGTYLTIPAVQTWVNGLFSHGETKKRTEVVIPPTPAPPTEAPKAPIIPPVKTKVTKKTTQTATASVGTIIQASCGGGIVVGGIASQAGGANCGPPPLVMTTSKRVVESDKDGLIKTIITVVPSEPVSAPTAVAIQFDNPITSMDFWVEGAASTSGGGPYRNGTHAMISIGTGFNPKHALLLTVYSVLPVTVVKPPTLE